MKKIFNDIEFTACTFIPACDPESRVTGIYIHDLNDEFGDGDGVAACDIPEDAEQASDMLFNEYVETDGDVLATVQFEA